MDNFQFFQPKRKCPTSLRAMLFACSLASTTLFAEERRIESENNLASFQLKSLHTTAFESIATDEAGLELAQTERLTLISTSTTVSAANSR